MFEPENTDDKIRFVRLISGEEIIGYIDDNEDCFWIEHPMIVEEMLTEEGKTSVILLNFIPNSIASGIQIKTRNILCSFDINDEFKKYFKYSILLSKERERDLHQLIVDANKRLEEYFIGDSNSFSSSIH